jgi:hypothetical protein
MIKRPYRPLSFFVGDDSANSSWLLPIYVIIQVRLTALSKIRMISALKTLSFVLRTTISGLELMMDRNNEFDKYQQEVDENRGDYGEEE